MKDVFRVFNTTLRMLKRRSPTGAMPGTVSVDPELPPAVIDVITFSNDEFHHENNVTAEKAFEAVGEGRVTWINVEGMGDEAVVRQLAGYFKLHPLTVEDIVHTHQRCKVEDYENYLFCVTRMSHEPNGDYDRLTEQISFVLGPNVVLSFQEGLPGDCFQMVRDRLRTKAGRIRERGADYFLYALTDSVIDSYFPTLERIGEALDECDDVVLEPTSHYVIAEIHLIKRKLQELRRTIWSMREAVQLILSQSNQLITANTKVFFRDCQDHTHQLIDVLETFRELCSDLRDTYFAAMGQRTNDVMRVLTIIATIFIPLSFIAGVYGMNFDSKASPWNMPELHWAWGYPFALSLMGARRVIAVVCLLATRLDRCFVKMIGAFRKSILSVDPNPFL